MSDTSETGQSRDREQALEQEIIADAERRARRIRDRAEREASRISADAEDQIEEAARQVLDAAKKEAIRLKEKAKTKTEQEIGFLRREVVYGVIRRIRDEAWRRLTEAAADDEHEAILRGLALLAIGGMESDDLLLRLRAEDRDRVGDRIADEIVSDVRDRLDREVRIRIDDEPLSAIGGLLVRDTGGREIAEQTFRRRMDRLWTDITGDLMGLVDWQEIAPWLQTEKGSAS